MTVGKLIEYLKNAPPDALVGCSSPTPNGIEINEMLVMPDDWGKVRVTLSGGDERLRNTDPGK